MAARLRVYYGPQDETEAGSVVAEPSPSVKVTLQEILPLLLDAVRANRTWLDDFAKEEITVSLDLYEVLLAYQHYRRPSA